MTTLELSPVISAYFERMNSPAKAGVEELFTPDALVIDDGNTYRGTDAIQGWLRGAASEYTVTTTVLAAERSDVGTGSDPGSDTGSSAETIVDVLLEGDFPGGRVELRHRFREEPTGLIGTLTIGIAPHTVRPVSGRLQTSARHPAVGRSSSRANDGTAGASPAR